MLHVRMTQAVYLHFHEELIFVSFKVLSNLITIINKREMSTAPPTLMSIRMENPATKFYHAVNNTIKILYNKKNLSTKLSEQLMNRKEEDRAQILF